MTDLYAVLGVARTATAAEIRAAYLALVKTAHPDQGGDREKFERIQEAWETLRNEEKRKLYDETGAFGTTATNDPEAQAVIAYTLALFDRLLSRADVDQLDLLEALKNLIDEQEQGLRETMKEIQRHQPKLKRVVSRMKKGGKDILTSHLRLRIKQNDDFMESVPKAMAQIAAARALVNEHGYDFMRQIESPEMAEAMRRGSSFFTFGGLR